MGAAIFGDWNSSLVYVTKAHMLKAQVVKRLEKTKWIEISPVKLLREMFTNGDLHGKNRKKW